MQEELAEPFGGKGLTASHDAKILTSFTGHRADEELGLINMRGRIYDPVVGRMMQADPFAGPDSQGLNRYAYVRNNPLSYTDPTGFCTGGTNEFGFCIQPITPTGIVPTPPGAGGVHPAPNPPIPSGAASDFAPEAQQNDQAANKQTPRRELPKGIERFWLGVGKFIVGSVMGVPAAVKDVRDQARDLLDDLKQNPTDPIGALLRANMRQQQKQGMALLGAGLHTYGELTSGTRGVSRRLPGGFRWRS